MLALGFSAGLPFLLVFDTLSAWLRESGLSLEVIGFFSLATLSYAFKFVWAPLVDRAPIPVLSPWLGRRRAWMLLAQIAIIAGLWAISVSDPAANLGLVALFAVLTGFSSATQDIAMDAWRIEVSEESEQGAMVAAYTWGYRISRIVAGVLPLVLAQAYSWSLSYFVMAVMMSVGIVAVLLAPREPIAKPREIPNAGVPYRPIADRLEWVARLLVLALGALLLGSGLSARADMLALPFSDAAASTLKTIWRAPGIGVWVQLASVIAGFGCIVLAAWPLPGPPTRPGVFLSHAFGDPLADFFRRYKGQALLIIAAICMYRVSDFTLNIMNPFYIDMGFSLTEIAEMRKVYGVVMTMAGVFLAGVAIARWGLTASFLAGAIIGPLSNLTFAWLATQGPDLVSLGIAIGIENISDGFSGTCLIAFMSSLTAEGFTATQYALFTSLYAIPGKLAGSQSGRIVEEGARTAEHGGLIAPLMRLFDGLPPTVLAEGAGKLGVTPAALGAGYIAFFIYTSLLGVIAIGLAVVVARRRWATAPAHSPAAGTP
jgi:PAT family beta-lactamase induction signal transducer AmpG